MRRMWIIFVIGALCLPASPRVFSQDRQPEDPSVAVDIKNDSVVNALQKVFQAAHRAYRFEDVEKAKIKTLPFEITLNGHSLPLSAALDIILNHAQPPLDYTVVNNAYIIHPQYPPEILEPSLQSGDVGTVQQLAISSNGLLACGDQEGRVNVWKLDGTLLYQLQGRIGKNPFKADGTLLACGEGNDVVLRNAQTGDVVHRMPSRSMGQIVSVSFSGDGKRLVCCGRNRRVHFGDAIRGEWLYTEPDEQEKCIMETQLNQDGSVAAFRPIEGWGSDYKDWRKQIGVWNLQRGRKIYLEHANSYFMALAFSPDGKTLATADLSPEICLWDLQDDGFWTLHAHRTPYRAMACSFQGLPLDQRENARLSLAFSSDGQMLCLAGAGPGVQAWDVATGKPRPLPVKVARENYSALAFSPEKEAGGEKNRVLAFGRAIWWDDPEKIQVAGIDNKNFHLSPTSTVLSTRSIAFNPDPKQRGMLATGGQSVRVWNFRTKERPTVLPGRAPVAFSPDGSLLAACSSDGRQIALWDPPSGSQLRTLAGHTGQIETFMFSPDGKLLASSGRDNHVLLWNVQTGRKLLTLDGLPSAAVTLRFSADSQVLAGISIWNQKTAILWDVSSPEFDLPRRQMLKLTAAENIRADCIAFSPMPQAAPHRVRTSGFDGAQTPELPQYVACETDGKLVVYPLATTPEGRPKPGQKVELGEKCYAPVFKSNQSLFVEHNGKIAIFPLNAAGRETGLQRIAPDFTRDSLEDLIGFSPDRKSFSLIATSNAHRDVEFKADNAISALSFSPDNRFVAGLVGNEMTRIWDRKTGRELLNLISVDQRDYLAFLPGNYYAASRDALNHFSLPYEQFELRLNRPDLILQKLGYAKPEAVAALQALYVERLRRCHVTLEEVRHVGAQPKLLHVESLNVSNGQTTSKSARLHITAHDPKIALARLEIYVNGVPVYGMKGYSLTENNSRDADVTLDLLLSAGKNNLDVTVRNRAGVASDTYRDKIFCSAPPGPRRLFALLVGVSHYLHSEHFEELVASRDAHDLAMLLKNLKRGTPPSARFPFVHKPFADVQTLTLTNEKATRSNILAARQFLQQAGLDDLVIVLVAGHGWRQTEETKKDAPSVYYFGSFEADPAHPQTTALTYDDLETLLDSTRSRNKILLMDTCHSGEDDKVALPATKSGAQAKTSSPARGLSGGQALASAKTTPGKRSVRRHARGYGGSESPYLAQSIQEQIESLWVDLRRGTGACVIAAAGAAQAAGEKSNGFFTQAVLECLGKAARQPQGHVTATTLREYVYKRVPRLSGNSQKPTLVRENLLNPIEIIGDAR